MKAPGQKTKEFRLPLAGSLTNRTSGSDSLTPTGGYVGLGVVGVMIVGMSSSILGKDQRFTNCFSRSVTDAVTGQKRIFSIKRPGFGTNNTPAAGEIGNALLVWTGEGTGQKIISSFGSTNSTIYDGTTSLGAITGKCTGITETFVSTTPTLTVTSDDDTAWYYDTGVGVMTQITDGQFPGNNSKTLAGTFAHLDGFNFIMDTDGVIWASDLNTVTSWTATSFGSANNYPDKGIGMVQHRGFLMCFGTESVEFLYNAGLTPFPFTKNTAITQKVGCVSADAIAQIGDTTFWCGSSPQGGLSIFQYDQGISRISTPEVDSMLILAGASNISMTSLRVMGLSFVIVVAANTTLVYCMEEKNWHHWSSAAPLWYKCVGVSIGGTMVNYSISKTSTDGKVYIQNQTGLVWRDDGTIYTAVMQLAPTDGGTKRRKFWEGIEFVGDQEEDSIATLFYSDDDYQTTHNLGTLDLSLPRPRLKRLGSSSRRAFGLAHSADTPFRGEALEGTFSASGV